MPSKFADIAEQQWNDIPEPKLLPEGTYLLRGTNVSYFPADKENDKSARVVFFYETKEAMDDVPESKLKELGEGYDFANNDIAQQFFINRAKDWDRVRKHLSAHGIDVDGKTMPETFEEFRGTEVLAHLVQDEYVNHAGVPITQNKPTLFEKV